MGGAVRDSPSTLSPGCRPAGTAQLVEGAVSILCRLPSGIFSMADLLMTLATKEDAKDRQLVLAALMDKLRWGPGNRGRVARRSWGVTHRHA
jgi:hypothetical protein